MQLFRPAVLVLAAASVVSAGCASVGNLYSGVFGSQPTKQVAPQEFVQRTPGNQPPPPTISQPPNLATPEQPVPPVADNTTPKPKPAEGDQPGGISKVIQNAIEPGGNPAPGGGTTTAPSTQPDMTLASGQFMELGGVVAIVGNTPIYANEVLKPLASELRTKARTEDPDHFALDAGDLIQRKIAELEINEVEFAAAKKSLDDNDKNLADALTRLYKSTLVTEAGGSPEVARRRAEANGDDFDELVYRRYRTLMIELYYQRKIYPLLQVGADDMRKYYRQHLDQFSKQAQVHFDLLGVNPNNLQAGNAAANDKLAKDKIEEARRRAANGEDFANLFKEFNNDDGLDGLSQGTGDMGTIRKGGFAIGDVENAVWKLQPGQVTDIITYKGSYYVAKLLERDDGNVRQFEDEQVQAAIHFALQSAQFHIRQQEEERKLLSEAIITADAPMLQHLVDMAMQSYRIWNAKT